jgi:ribose transport system substrate-binding protein
MTGMHPRARLRSLTRTRERKEGKVSSSRTSILRPCYVLSASLCALTLAATGCGSSGSSSAAGASKPAKTITIGMVTGTLTDSYYVTMEYGAEKEAKQLGVKLDYTAAPEFSTSAQITEVDAILATNPSALILDPDDGTALLAPVEQAHASGIPVVIVDNQLQSYSDVVARVTSNSVAGGEQAGEVLSQAMGGKGLTLEMASTSTSPNDVSRLNGFAEELKANPNLKNVGVQYTQAVPATGATEIEDVLQRYPNLTGVFCADSFSCVGAIKGLTAVGKINQVKVVGYDAEPVTMQAIDAGQQVATVAQEPALEGELAVKYAVAAAEGHTSGIPKLTETPNRLITHANFAATEQYAYITKP